MYTQAEWDAELEANYDKAAAALLADGWTRYDDQPTFSKADKTVYLARQLGSSHWEPPSKIFDRSVR